MNEVLSTDIREFPLFSRGKVRDVYDLGETLLFIATDRVSAFDVVMPNGIPGRGRLLTAVSVFWFNYLSDVVGNHMITADVDRYPKELKKYREILDGRSMLVKKARRVDVECIVRGYISGSMWKEYKAARAEGMTTLHGIDFPSDLKESDRLPEPIFSPSTKAEEGHDINISFAQMIRMVGRETSELCRDKSLAVYTKAAEYARSRGIIIADTKFEFGFAGDEFILIDEVLSPDSSRFWPDDRYQPGESQPSFDKQIVRDYLDALKWDKRPPAPALPQEVIEKTLKKYQEVVERLTR